MKSLISLAIIPALFCVNVALAGLSAHETLILDSPILGESRELWVALPDDYATSGDHYPVLYVLDAGWHFESAVAATRMLAETSYIQNHRIPRLIIVGVLNHDRNRDYTPTRSVSQHGMSFPTSGGGDAFLEFMGSELIPSIDRRYRTQPYRILAGWSLGGLLTMHALLEHPDLFGAHLAISPSLWWEDGLLVKRAGDLARAGAIRQRDLVITVGTAEEGGLCYNAVHELVERWNETPLGGLNSSLVEIPDEDHNHAPFKAYFDGLRELFSDWFFPEEIAAAGLDALQKHYAALSERRGYPIAIPGHIYDALSRSYLAEGRADDAIALMRARCSQTPASPISHFRLGEVCRNAGDADAARDAYGTALGLEQETSAPDSVFIRYVEQLVRELDGESK